MKSKKILAGFLGVIMMIGYLPEGVLANPQRPIQEIQKITVAHQQTNTIDNGLSIVPKIQMDWVAPLENLKPTNSNDDDTKEPTYYDFKISNVHDKSNIETIEVDAKKFTENAGILSMNAEEYFKSFFKNGALYETQIIAKHKHYIDKDGYTTWVDAPLSGEPIPKAHFITDFDLRADASQGLTFSWEYIPGVSYFLYYEKGNKDSISEMTGTGKAISAEEAKSNLSEDKTRVVWKADTAIPGQIYSAYIVPIGIEHNSIKFDEIYYNATSPKLIHVTPNIPLEIEAIGSSKLRLSWDIKDAAWVAVGNKLHQTIIWQIDENNNKVELGRIYNHNNGGKDVGYFECIIPSGTVTYIVDFIVENSSGMLELGFSAGPKVYPFSELREVPMQPYIPDLFSFNRSDLLTNTEIALQNKYKVKFNGVYNDFMLDNGNIETFKKDTFHYVIEEDKANIQLVWDAPQVGKTKEVDYNLYYDIWVSEEADEFSKEHLVVSDLKILETDTGSLIYKTDGKTVVGMKTILKGLDTNKTYYIKIVAKRKYSDTEEVSIPNIKEISIDKVGDVYEPPAVGKPPLQVIETTKDRMKIGWTEQWYEVVATKEQAELYTDSAEKLLAQWGHSRLYLSKDEKLPIRFRDEEDIYGDPIDLYGSNVQSKIKKLESIFKTEKYILSPISMGSDTHYRVKVMKQKDVDEQRQEKSLEEWVSEISKDEIEKTWEDVTTQLSDVKLEGVDGKSLVITKDDQGNPLKPNMPYIVLISAARKIDGEWKYSIIPSFVLGTTSTDHQSNLETPKTPVLYNYEDKDVKDMEIAVRWIYNKSFDYELVYSRLDDPNQATVWEFTEEDKKQFIDGQEVRVTISGLLPETTYNFWIRAKQKPELVLEGEPKQSDWSTPVTSTTLTLGAPLPPSGLGLASYQSIQEVGKDFMPKGEDYLTVEWMRNPSDVNNQDSRIAYSYIVEFADNPKFVDGITVTVGDTAGGEGNTGDAEGEEGAVLPEILSKNMVKFSGLRAYSPYYIRVKTVLTFTEGDKVITRESEYTAYIRIITERSNDEYDGGDNPNIIEYPNPIVEDYKNGTWTYEIVDAAKITTQILEANQFYYTITLENYKGKHDAVTRSLKMPIKVLSTLANRGMTLQVVTNIATYEIPGQALKSYINQYQGTDKVQFDLTRKSYSDISNYVRSYPETYQSGEVLKVTFRGNAKNTTVNTFNQPIKVKLKLDVATSYNYTNFNTYLYNYSIGNWESYPYQVDIANNKYLAYNTMYTGLNALYSRATQATNTNSNYLMNALTSTYNITGLGTTHEQTDYVKASQYVKLILGIAEDSKGINLTEQASSKDYAAAKASSIYISNSRGNVSKEQALAGVVRLYEIKKGYKVKASNRTFSNVSANYREAVSKAYAIGMIDSISEPQDSITYSELCDWIALAID